MIKRIFDILLSVFGIIVLSPILIATAVAVKATSPGPVFYRGVRTGLHGKPFRIFKFRSMVAGAEKLGGTTTAQYDARITGVGAFIRKFKIDELPQLFNVLFGTMSFVGPRPEVQEYTDMYSDEEKKILTVKPGITDYSSMEFHDLQTHVGEQNADDYFRRNILPKKNALRLKYVNERSFAVDVSILLKTVWLVLGKLFRKKNAS